MAAKKKSARGVPKGAVEASAFLEKLIGPTTFGNMMRALRETEEASQGAWAKRLGIKVGHLCDIEKDRRAVSVERAAKWAKLLGYSEALFVALALQAQLDEAGLKLRVNVEAA